MAIVAGSQIDVGRALLAALQPLTGDRSSGYVDAALEAGSAELVAGNYLQPVVEDKLRPNLLFKLAPKPDGSMKWTLPADGPLRIVSNLGGARYNLPEGTKLYWDPPQEGVAPYVVVRAGGLVGGANLDSPISFADGVLYETSGTTGLELFRSGVAGFPAVIAQWADSDPADGLATSSLRRGDTRAGEGTQFFAEAWNVDVVVSRSDTEGARRAQGLILMDEVTSLLTDRQTVDGVVISHPSGIQIRRRLKVTGLPRDIVQAFQVYEVQLVVTGSYVRADTRTYNPLAKFKLDVPKYDPGPAGDLPIVRDNRGTFEQPP